MTSASASARFRSVLAAGILAGLAVLAGGGPGLGAATPPSPVRITLVSHTWLDEDFTLGDDAAFGLTRFRAASGHDRVVTQWIPLPRDADASPKGLKVALAYALSQLRLAAQSSEIVIAWGNLVAGPALTLAVEYPSVRFGVVSTEHFDHPPSNVMQGSFKSEEAAFLAGAVAAMISESRTIGYIGAYESNAQRIGFTAGAYYANPRVRVIVDYVGHPANAGWEPGGPREGIWIAAGAFQPALHDARKAEEVALSQFDRGVDVIYTASGGSNTGVYEAAAARRRWVIGSGGPRTEGTLPARWQRQIFAVVTIHADHAVYDLASRLDAKPPESADVAWSLTSRNPLGVIIDYTTHKRQFDRIRPYTTALIREIQLRRVKVPYSRPQLLDFMKEFPP